MPLSDDDPQAVKLMIYYFYHLDYPHVSLYSEDDGNERGDEVTGDTGTGSSVLDDAKDKTDQAPPEQDMPQPQTEIVQDAEEAPPPSEEIFHPTMAPEPELDTWFPPTRGKKLGKKKFQRPNLFDEVNVPAEPVPNILPAAPLQAHPIAPRPKASQSSDQLVQSPNLIIHAKMYALAEKYAIGGLKGLSQEKFAAELEKHWDCTEFSQAILEAYSSIVQSDRELRDLVVNALHQHRELLDKEDIRNVVRNSDLAYDLLMYVHERRRW